MPACREVSCKEFTAIIQKTREVFARSVAERLVAQYVLMRAVGLRVGEACQLRVRDVSTGGRVGNYGTIPAAMTKTKESRSMDLSQPVQRQLRAWFKYSGLGQHPDRYLFPPTPGGHSDQPFYRTDDHVDHRTVRKALRHVCQLLGLPPGISTHSLRQTFAQAVHVALGNDLYQTQHALRHKNISSTIHYLRLDTRRVSSAILHLFEKRRAVAT